jgi:hypothetical protein
MESATVQCDNEDTRLGHNDNHWSNEDFMKDCHLLRRDNCIS